MVKIINYLFQLFLCFGIFQCFSDIFFTLQCGESSACMKTCKSDELDCYVVDNNGYVVVSENLRDSGRFFGEVRPPIMRQLVAEKVFRQVQISDYQAICGDFPESNSPACRLLTVPTYAFINLLYFLLYTLGENKLGELKVRGSQTRSTRKLVTPSRDVYRTVTVEGLLMGERSHKTTLYDTASTMRYASTCLKVSNEESIEEILQIILE